MLDEHKMFEKFRGGETSKQGQAHVRQTVSVISPGLKRRERFGRNDTKCAVQNMEGSRFFPGPFRRGGDLSPHMGDKV